MGPHDCRLTVVARGYEAPRSHFPDCFTYLPQLILTAPHEEDTGIISPILQTRELRRKMLVKIAQGVTRTRTQHTHPLKLLWVAVPLEPV